MSVTNSAVTVLNLRSVSVGFYEKTAVHGSVLVFTVPGFNHVQSKH